MMRATSRRSGATRLGLILTTVCMTSIFLLISPASAGHGSTIHVQAGKSIQAAINTADQGDTIIVAAGIYEEQLTIDKDGIDLIGWGAVLTPPASPTKNLCSGLAGPDTEAGICVMGSGVKLAPFVQEHRKVLSVAERVADVSITGFQVVGFSGPNVVVVGGQDAHVSKNTLIDGAAYGFLTVGSKGTHASGNTIVATSTILFIALCMDDVGDVHISNNHLSGYGIGLCVQTAGADIQHNDVSDCCVGAFVDPGVHGATLLHNRFSATNPNCATEFPIPPGGIFLDGSVNTKVEFNLIEGQKSGGMAAGVAVVDEPTTTPVSIASGNVVTANDFRNNDFDIYVNTTGTGNVVSGNQCSTPASICG